MLFWWSGAQQGRWGAWQRTTYRRRTEEWHISCSRDQAECQMAATEQRSESGMEGGGTSNKPSLNWRVLDHLMWMTAPLSVKCRSPRVRCLDGSKTLSEGDTRLDLRKKEVQQWIGTRWPHELEGKYPAAYAVSKVSSVIGCFCRWPVPIILLRPFLQRDTGKLVMASHGKQWYRCSNRMEIKCWVTQL